MISAFFTLTFLAGCDPVEPVDPAAAGPGFEMQTAGAEETESPRQGGQEPVELEMLPEDFPEPEDVDIEDAVRDPDTVLATVDGEDILLQDLYDEFARFPAHQQVQVQHQQHLLLEEMVHQKLLSDEAANRELDESEAYKALVEEIKASPVAEDLDEGAIADYALSAALVQVEVIDRVEVSEEQIEAFFEQNRHMLPEETELEDVKPQIENMLLNQARTEKYRQFLGSLYEEAEVDLNEEWVQEKREEAAEAMPPGAPGAPEGQEPPSR